MSSGRSIVVQGTVGKAEDVVVFLPPAGSITSPYFPIGACLPDTLPAVHCEMPGRGRTAGEQTPGSVHGAVDRWADELAALLPGRRLHLFGHSLGALFAYELAIRFEDRSGTEAASLSASGAREPGSTPRSLVATAFAALRGQRGTTDKEGDREGAWLTDDLRLRQEYVTAKQPIRAPLALFCGISDPFARPAEMEEWKRFTKGPWLGMFTFPGGHDYYLSGQESIAAEISQIVDRSQDPERMGVENDG
ncbi:alpha/beta fold hydrolase [Streptomyces atratus]|uniref:Surfactin synthase thioesterase subunit n=2 Tax=Streptomyces atratus TaxID=1893 RepID=A0A1K2DA15_STRAR|nr:Surfactin synthase thioesterase subunit [Streptomyces atratus]